MAAELAVVALGIDTSALKRGEVQATASLKNIEAEMARAETQAGKLGTELGKSVSKADQSISGMNASVGRLTGSLSSLGGPVGQLAGQVSNLSGQFGGLSESFGLVGGAAVAAVAGVAALGAGLAKLTLEGVKVSDAMGDIAEGTGLTIDQVQRLGAAFALAGEDVGSVQRSFQSFASNVQAAIKDPTSEAAENLAQLGINAKEAGRNLGDSFIDSLTRIKELRETTAGLVATNEVYGRGIGALARSNASLNQLLADRAQLERSGKIATLEAVEAGGQLDAKINALSNSWTVFKQNLAAGVVGNALKGWFDDMSALLSGQQDQLKDVIGTWQYYQSLGDRSGLRPRAGATPESRFTAEEQKRFGSLFELGQSRPDLVGEVRKAGIDTQQDLVRKRESRGSTGRTQIDKEAEEAARALEKATADAVASTKTLAKQIGDDLVNSMNALNLELRETTARAKKPFFLPIPGGEQEPLPSEVGANLKKAQQDYLGAFFNEFFGSISEDFAGQASRAAAEKEKERREQINEAFASVFDDAVVSLLRGKTTFTGALIGTIDGVFTIFAEEFARSMRESFVDPLIRQLTDFLRDSLTELFGNFSGKGIGGFFTSLLKSFGGFFGGFFAQGGTLGAHQFGVVGENGPEFVFSGSHPMTISPTAQMAGGPVTMNFMVAPDASGNVSRRTQDQIADSVLRGLQQSQKLKGAR